MPICIYIYMRMYIYIYVCIYIYIYIYLCVYPSRQEGFIRMARGVDESGVESIAEAADVLEEPRRGFCIEPTWYLRDGGLGR